MSMTRHARPVRVGDRIQERRKALSITGQQLAEHAKVSIDTVRSIESGRVPNPGILTVAKLAGVLNSSLDDLAGHRVRRARR